MTTFQFQVDDIIPRNLLISHVHLFLIPIYRTTPLSDDSDDEAYWEAQEEEVQEQEEGVEPKNHQVNQPTMSDLFGSDSDDDDDSDIDDSIQQDSDSDDDDSDTTNTTLLISCSRYHRMSATTWPPPSTIQCTFTRCQVTRAQASYS